MLFLGVGLPAFVDAVGLAGVGDAGGGRGPGPRRSREGRPGPGPLRRGQSATFNAARSGSGTSAASCAPFRKNRAGTTTAIIPTKTYTFT